MANDKPTEDTMCCRERCTKKATLFAAWGDPYCRDCMWATDHAIDVAQGTIKLNLANGLNDDGTMTRTMDDVGNPRYETELDARNKKGG
jgi:hypothetical protein